jgi:uncharacterized protein
MSAEQQVVDMLRKRFPLLQAVYAFGSWGTDDERERSDADIAMLLSPSASKKTTSEQLMEAREDLASALGREVDLIDLRAANTVLQKEVVSASRRLYCANPYEAETFEMLTLSFYQKLNEERADILADIERSGRILAI